MIIDEALADEQDLTWFEEFDDDFEDEWLNDEEQTENRLGKQSKKADSNEDIANLFDGLDI